MKRTSATIIASVALILTAPAAFAAVDLSIGGTCWYTWWHPSWADAKAISRAINPTPEPIIMPEDSHDFKKNANFMAGPIVSIAFLERWSIQSVFTIGKFVFSTRGPTTELQVSPSNAGFMPAFKGYRREILKWDSDTSIGCAVHRIVKIFAGFKHQGYRYREDMKDIIISANPALFTRDLADDVRAYGGGLGIGLTIPVVADFYIMPSVSGVVLWSVEKISVRQMNSVIYSVTDGLLPLFFFPRKGHYLSYGGTAALSFTYNIQKINTTISLGGRYQLLFNRQGYSKINIFYNDVSMNVNDRQYDHFFGVTLSAIYTFHIGKKA